MITDSSYMNLLVLLPALNEERSIHSTIMKIWNEVPNAEIVVIDNGSTDKTVEVASSTGVVVVHEPQKGKGFAIRRGFSIARPEHEIIFMVDADDTYGLENLKAAVQLVDCFGFDMVVGKRIVREKQDKLRKESYKKGHNLGNFVLTLIAKMLHKVEIEDSLSGWRVMSKSFVKSFAGGASGFEIEAELNAHVYILSAPVANVEVSYQGRQLDSHSKLNTFRDGWKILRMNFSLFKDNRPQYAFALFSFPWMLASIYLISRAWIGYLKTGLVNQFPSLIAGIGSLIVSALLLTSGLVLQRIKLARATIIRFEYQRR